MDYLYHFVLNYLINKLFLFCAMEVKYGERNAMLISKECITDFANSY